MFQTAESNIQEEKNESGKIRSREFGMGVGFPDHRATYLVLGMVFVEFSR